MLMNCMEFLGFNVGKLNAFLGSVNCLATYSKLNMYHSMYARTRCQLQNLTKIINTTYDHWSKSLRYIKLGTKKLTEKNKLTDEWKKKTSSRFKASLISRWKTEQNKYPNFGDKC